MEDDIYNQYASIDEVIFVGKKEAGITAAALNGENEKPPLPPPNHPKLVAKAKACELPVNYHCYWLFGKLPATMPIDKPLPFCIAALHCIAASEENMSNCSEVNGGLHSSNSTPLLTSMGDGETDTEKTVPLYATVNKVWQWQCSESHR